MSKKTIKKGEAKKTAKTVKSKDSKEDTPIRKVKTPQLLRGFRDILPEEQTYWDVVRNTAVKFAHAYSFGRIELPILEPVDLFVRSVGKGTDIVEKEMFSFQDQSGTNVVMRPEATASTARAYIEHGMIDRPQPVKMFYIGSMFRYDRPQAGRYRQFNQFGFESFGSADPIIDAQLIIIAYSYFKELGVPIVIKVNSIGTPESRSEYKVELVSYFRQHRNLLSDDDKRRLQKNPLRLLDSKEEYMNQILPDAPQILDWLDEKSKNHFMKVLEYLEEMEVPYVLDPHLVRGLDYYTRTVFEIIPQTDEGADGEEKRQIALGGGGRYDGLVELLGGRETPACGFAVGIERVVNAMKQSEIIPGSDSKRDVFLAVLGDAARGKGLQLFEDFRKQGIRIAESFGKSALKAQLELADRHKVRLTLILGQKEVLDGTIILRDMETGAQETVDIAKIVDIVKKQLK